jgi:hypothetical protein
MRKKDIYIFIFVLLYSSITQKNKHSIPPAVHGLRLDTLPHTPAARKHTQRETDYVDCS